MKTITADVTGGKPEILQLFISTCTGNSTLRCTLQLHYSANAFEIRPVQSPKCIVYRAVDCTRTIREIAFILLRIESQTFEI
jgi:hypothetical protein